MGWVGVWLAFYLFWIAPVILTVWLAARWHRHPLAWGAGAFFCGIFALAAFGVVIGTTGAGRTAEGSGPSPGNPWLTSPPPRSPGPAPTPRPKTLVIALVAGAVLSGAVFATATGGPAQVAGVAVRSDADLPSATENALQLVTDLPRDADDMTFGRFVTERLRARCGIEVAGFRISVSFRSWDETRWAVWLQLDDPRPNDRCDEDHLLHLQRQPLAGIRSTDAVVFPVYDSGQPRHDDGEGTWLHDFLSGHPPS